MKRITWCTAILLFLALTFRAQAILLPVFGPATINFSASEQNLYFSQVSSNASHTSTSTNITQVYKSSVTNFVINSAYLLNLLTNSLNTNLPPGAKLFMEGSSSFIFYVTDSTGTNTILNSSTVGTVLLLTYSARAIAGSETYITSQSASGTTHSGNDTEAYTEYVILSYDDSALTTGDGTHSTFQISGILVEKLSNTIATGKYKETVSLPGAGGGRIRDTYVVMKGSLTAALAGVLAP